MFLFYCRQKRSKKVFPFHLHARKGTQTHKNLTNAEDVDKKFVFCSKQIILHYLSFKLLAKYIQYNTIKAGGSTVRAQSKMSEWVSGVEWLDTP